VIFLNKTSIQKVYKVPSIHVNVMIITQ